VNVIFAGTPAFAVPTLRAISQAGHKILAVYTQPDRPAGRGRKLLSSPVKQYALDKGYVVRQPHTLLGEETIIADGNCDVMVVVAFGKILSQEVLDAPRLECINVHASLLPRWRGAAPIQRAIEAGDPQTGISIMRMEAGLDTGPVYESAVIPITDEDTAQSVHDRLAELGATKLQKTLSSLTDGTAIAIGQDNSQASYAKKLEKKEAEINWSEPASRIHCRIRAFNPWPVCQTHHGKDRIRVWQAVVLEGTAPNLKTGEIVEIRKDSILVSCGSGLLGVTHIQRDGSKPMPVGPFLAGYKLSPGGILGPKTQTPEQAVKTENFSG
jgi:methionyl-tRNA formyltransferase